jgi:hypothetical protein
MSSTPEIEGIYRHFRSCVGHGIFGGVRLPVLPVGQGWGKMIKALRFGVPEARRDEYQSRFLYVLPRSEKVPDR